MGGDVGEVKTNNYEQEMNKLTSFLIDEQQAHRKGGLYHKTQVQLAYNSNRIEGSKLTEEQTQNFFFLTSETDPQLQKAMETVG